MALDAHRKYVDDLLKDLAGYYRGHVRGWYGVNSLHATRINTSRTDPGSRPLLRDDYGFDGRPDLQAAHVALAGAPRDVLELAHQVYLDHRPMGVRALARHLGVSHGTVINRRNRVIEYVMHQLLGDQAPRVRKTG